MRLPLNQEQSRKIAIARAGIRFWMAQKGIKTASELANRTGFTTKEVEDILGQGPIPALVDFLDFMRASIRALGLAPSGRSRSVEDTEDSFDFDDCVETLSPPTPTQGSFCI